MGYTHTLAAIFLCNVLILYIHLDAKGLDRDVSTKPLLAVQDRTLISLKSHIKTEHTSAPGRLSQLLLRLGSITFMGVEFRQLLTEKRPLYGQRLKLLDSLVCNSH